MKIEKINKDQICFDPNNPRSKFDEEEIELLLKSIEEDGQKEPIHLEKLSEKQYLVNEGNKRVAAIQKSKKVMIVNAIVEQKLSAEERLFKQIIIDTHRKNWKMSDRDNAWKRLWDMGKYDAKSFAKKISTTKGIVESFLDRVDLGEEFVKKIENVSAYNITETARLKNKDLRKKVLTYANKKELARRDIRKLSQLADKVDNTVLEEVFKDKISIDDAENMIGLTSERQQQALETTKTMNKHKKKLKSMLNNGQIQVENKPLVENATKKITMFQQAFFKLSSDLRAMSSGLDVLNREETRKYINKDMVNILESCLDELKTGVLPGIKAMERTLEEVKNANK